MERRTFIGRTIIGGALLGGAAAVTRPNTAHATVTSSTTFSDDLFVERDLPGQPHKGKALAVVQAHSDDIPFFCAGLVAKLIKEGYTGYLIRTTNDEVSGRGSIGQGLYGNEIDNSYVAKALGLEQAIDLNYRKHRMDADDIQEIRGRFIFLFRVLKIDTAIFFDPWDHYEENPDHYWTAKAVDSACWHAGKAKDYPEHIKAGIRAHSVKERYYYARGPQLVNRIVDISSVIDKKVESNLVNKNLGPAGDAGIKYRAQLAQRGLRLPILDGDDHTANFNYVKEFLLEDEKKLGKRFGCEYAEPYHYVGPGFPLVAGGASSVMMPTRDEYTKKNAVPIQ